jgi:hypothetical protein
MTAAHLAVGSEATFFPSLNASGTNRSLTIGKRKHDRFLNCRAGAALEKSGLFNVAEILPENLER